MSGSAVAPGAGSTGTRLDSGAAIRAGWELFKEHIGVLALIAIIVWAVTGSLSWVAQRADGLTYAVAQLASIVAGQVVAIGWLRVSLRLVDGRPAEPGDLVRRLDLVVPFFLASLLFSIAVSAGLVLLVIPGVIAAIALGFYGFRIVDREEGALQALASSAELTRGHRGELFVFGLVLLGLNLLGALAFGVGIVVTSAISLLAVAWVYRQLAPAAR